jgi:hypothetical protein
MLSDDERVKKKQSMSDRHQLLSDDERVKEKSSRRAIVNRRLGPCYSGFFFLFLFSSNFFLPDVGIELDPTSLPVLDGRTN